jgi:Tfp pilus assembly protein PilF
MGPPSFDWAGAPLRFLSMGDGYLKYLQALFAPAPFKFCDDIVFATQYSDPKVFLTLFMLALMLAAWTAALKKRGPVLFGLTFFILSLGPYLHLIPFYPRWAEHYLYIPGAGLTVLAACLFRRVFRESDRTIAICLTVFALFAGFLCVRTYQRNLYYNDSERYYEALTQTSTPYAHFGYTNMGRIYFAKNDLAKAGVYFRTAVRIEPSEPVGHYNLGLYYLRLKDYPKSYESFKKSYNLGNTGFPALHNAAVCLVHLKKYADAAAAFEAAWKISPDNLNVYENIIQVYCLLGDRASAGRWAETGLEQFKDKPVETCILRMAAAMAAYRFGDDASALRYLEKIAAESPGSYLYGDVALAATGKTEPAAFEKLIATRYAAYETAAKSYLMTIYVLRGDGGAARDYLEKNRIELEGQPDKEPILVRQELARVEGGAGYPQSALTK